MACFLWLRLFSVIAVVFSMTVGIERCQGTAALVEMWRHDWMERCCLVLLEVRIHKAAASLSRALHSSELRFTALVSEAHSHVHLSGT